jgi:hypothetical protein
MLDIDSLFVSFLLEESLYTSHISARTRNKGTTHVHGIVCRWLDVNWGNADKLVNYTEGYSLGCFLADLPCVLRPSSGVPHAKHHQAAKQLKIAQLHAKDSELGWNQGTSTAREFSPPQPFSLLLRKCRSAPRTLEMGQGEDRGTR